MKKKILFTVLFALLSVSVLQGPNCFLDSSHGVFNGLSLRTSEAWGDVVPRIVGGHDANKEDWPWIAALAKKGASPYDGHFCGGSLIDSNWVLTAAHCLFNKDHTPKSKESFGVLLGIYDLKQDKTYKTFKVKTVAVHPSYDDVKSHDWDVALLELTEPATGFPTVSLYPGSSSLVGISSDVAGWGNTSSTGGGDYPAILQEVALPIVSNDVCKAFYGDRLTERMMCAGYAGGGKDSCDGDSGGPMVVKVGENRVLSGVVSWGIGCAKPGQYGVYARVSKFRGFIAKTMESTFISGKITTSVAGHKDLTVTNATVTIKGTKLQDKTDSNGDYMIFVPKGALEEGDQTLVFEANLMKTGTESIEYKEGKDLVVNEALKVDACPSADILPDEADGTTEPF